MLQRGLSFDELLRQMKNLNRFTDQLEEADPMRRQQKLQAYVNSHPVSMTAAEIAGFILGKHKNP